MITRGERTKMATKRSRIEKRSRRTRPALLQNIRDDGTLSIPARQLLLATTRTMMTKRATAANEASELAFLPRFVFLLVSITSCWILSSLFSSSSLLPAPTVATTNENRPSSSQKRRNIFVQSFQPAQVRRAPTPAKGHLSHHSPSPHCCSSRIGRRCAGSANLFGISSSGAKATARTAAAAAAATTTMADDTILEGREEKKDQQEASPAKTAVSFSHIHLYVDYLEDVGVYKRLERQLNDYAEKAAKSKGDGSPALSIEERRKIWESIAAPADGGGDDDDASSSSSAPFVPHGRDVVKQLLSGFGFRVTAVSQDNDESPPAAQGNGGGGSPRTRSLLVTSRDPRGVQILVTAKHPKKDAEEPEATSPRGEESGDGEAGVGGIFGPDKFDAFYGAHGGRQGVAALGFLVDDLEVVRNRYAELHPNLIAHDYESILEVYAFYDEGGGDHHDISKHERVPDKGTILRFVQQQQQQQQQSKDSEDWLVLPGLKPVEATFDDTTQAAYCDHWVSNVHSRTDFLDILSDTLGFAIKVDFNAGVVAAGEAQIESTVTGNDSILRTTDKARALRDQSQVYLPINNALSGVGHVHGFLKELGQGIQHMASRVDDLVDFVQRGNDYRKITGEGFTFLRIPRSYYGILTTTQLQEGLVGSSEGVSMECADAIVATLKTRGVVANDGSVDLDLTRDDIELVLESCLVSKTEDSGLLEEYRNNKAGVLDVVAQSRYRNLYSLLRDHLSEESYLGIVRNQILVDIQGEDLLYQIFTANILQRNPGDEAPFFEFIQRVCSESSDEKGCPAKIRPGCGGFGIRNFLTLFLSIEVSKAMQEASDALDAGDEELAKYAQTMVDFFTEQLNESNPILTQISDAMTEEGKCKERMTAMLAANDLKAAEMWREKMDAAAALKQNGNEKLMACSGRYNSLMKSLREERNSSA